MYVAGTCNADKRLVFPACDAFHPSGYDSMNVGQLRTLIRAVAEFGRQLDLGHPLISEHSLHSRSR